MKWTIIYSGQWWIHKLYSNTSDKLGEAYFCIAWWEKVDTPDPVYCITV